MSDRFGARIPAYRLEETELHLLQMSGEETDWSYTPVPTLSKTSLLSYFFINQLFRFMLFLFYSMIPGNYEEFKQCGTMLNCLEITRIQCYLSISLHEFFRYCVITVLPFEYKQTTCHCQCCQLAYTF